MYTEIEQQTLDIDWFFTDDNEIAFVASAGGKLPKAIAELGDENGLLSSYFRNLPNISEVVINPQLEDILQNVDEKYLSDFINMSKKGLYSFDKTVLNDFSDYSYHLVAKPIAPITLNDLSANILDIILNTKSNKKLKDIKLLNILKDF